jgi:hypothetical protein
MEQSYKLRAECIFDVTQLMIYLPIINNILVERDKKFPDCYVTFDSKVDLDTILGYIKRIKGDNHIMYETLQYSGEYNGDRVRSYF